MWWVIVPILIAAWLFLGALMAKRVLQDGGNGVPKIEGNGDYLMVGLVTIAGPIYIPILVPFWGIGWVVVKVMGLKKKVKTK